MWGKRRGHGWGATPESPATFWLNGSRAFAAKKHLWGLCGKLDRVWVGGMEKRVWGNICMNYFGIFREDVLQFLF